MPDTENKDDVQVRPFAAVLQDVAAGRAHIKLSRELHELIAGVNATGKKGELNIKVSLQPASKGSRALVMTVSSTAKTPKVDEEDPNAIFFVDNAGNLTRNDPEQLTLPLRSVDNTREAIA